MVGYPYIKWLPQNMEIQEVYIFKKASENLKKSGRMLKKYINQRKVRELFLCYFR